MGDILKECCHMCSVLMKRFRTDIFHCSEKVNSACLCVTFMRVRRTVKQTRCMSKQRQRSVRAMPAIEVTHRSLLTTAVTPLVDGSAES